MVKNEGYGDALAFASNKDEITLRDFLSLEVYEVDTKINEVCYLFIGTIKSGRGMLPDLFLNLRDLIFSSADIWLYQ